MRLNKKNMLFNKWAKSILSINLLFFIVSFQALFSQDHEDKYNEMLSKNKIKLQEVIEHDYIDGKPQKSGVKSRVTSYDQFGNRIEEINYRPDGSLLSMLVFKYDERNNRIEFVQYDSKKKPTYKVFTKYDEKNRKIFEEGFNGAENTKNYYFYDDMARLKEIHYYLQGSLDEKRVFLYNGYNAEILITDAKGKKLYKMLTKYDMKWNLLEEQRVENNKSITYVMKYKYDMKGNMVMEEKLINSKLNYRVEKIYNEKGQHIETYKETLSTEKYLSNKFSYHPNGFIAEEQFRGSAVKGFSKNTYTYDNGIRNTKDSYYADYDYQVLTVYSYENF